MPRRVLFSLPRQFCASTIVNYLHSLQYAMLCLLPLGLCRCCSFSLEYSSRTGPFAWLALPLHFQVSNFMSPGKSSLMLFTFEQFVLNAFSYVLPWHISFFPCPMTHQTWFYLFSKLLLLDCKLHFIYFDVSVTQHRC